MKREYWISPEMFETQVSVKKVGNNRVTIKPDIFHPNEGGQPCDKGTIGNADVLSVEIFDGLITIELSKDLTDGEYKATIDKSNRLFTSRHHTAQHIISGIAEQNFGLKTTGVHIGDNSTIDFELLIKSNDLECLELESNRVVMMDIPVSTAFGSVPSRFDDRLHNIDSDNLRVVSIGDIDSSACCGAHVSTTGKVGMIRIVSSEKKRGGSRIVFLAGDNALKFSRHETCILSDLRKVSNCSSDEMVRKFSNLIEDNIKLQQELTHMWKQNLPSIADNCNVVTMGDKQVGLIVEPLPQKLQGKLMSMITKSKDVGIIVSNNSISITSGSLSAKDLLNRIIGDVGGKGGGNDRTAKGYLSCNVTEKQIKAILSTQD